MTAATRIDTEVLIVGSGAGGAVTAATLARAGRRVTVLEEGPWLAADSSPPFSLEEMVTKYRHAGSCAALGRPAIAFAEGRCVGGSTEINSGLYHRLPDDLAAEWQRTYAITDFEPEVLARYAAAIEAEVGVSRVPGPPPSASAVLARGADALGWRSVEFARVFRYGPDGRGEQQTMSRTMLPAAVAAGTEIVSDIRVDRLERSGRRITAAHATRTRPDGTTEAVVVNADHFFVCAGATQTPALLQRSGFRHQIGNGLKMHPTVKIAARFPTPVSHGEVPMHRVTEFAPGLTIGGSASRRAHVALALADPGADYADALADWERVAVYYAAIRSEGSGRVIALPGLRAPLVAYNLTEGDMSRLARSLVHLGEVLLAAGATELYPSVAGAPVARSTGDLAAWWDAVTRNRANLMTVHLTSTVRIGRDRSRTGADSHGRVHGMHNLRVNDASLIPDAPGVNPQGAVMAIAARNADHFLSGD